MDSANQSYQKTVIRQSPLLEYYRSKQATLTQKGDWLLPAHFGDPIAEYDAIRNKAGIFDLCQRSLLRLTGVDRSSFLNSLVSNDLNALSAWQGLHAAFLTPFGNILADARIFCASDFLIVDVPESRKGAIQRHMQHNVVIDVRLEDLSAKYTMVSIQGPCAERLVRVLAATPDLPSADLNHWQVTIANIPVVIIAITHGAELGYDLVVPLPNLLDVVRQMEDAGKRWSISWVGIEAQEMLRIEAGIPVYGTDIGENNLLVESGQDRWISFKRHFAGFILESKQTVETGAMIRDGKREIGTVTSCRFSPRLDTAVALGYIRRDYLSPGTRVIIGNRDESIAGTLCTLPIP